MAVQPQNRFRPNLSLNFNVRRIWTNFRRKRHLDDLEANNRPECHQQGRPASPPPTNHGPSAPLPPTHPTDTLTSGCVVPVSIHTPSHQPSETSTVSHSQSALSQTTSLTNASSTVQSTQSLAPIFTLSQSSHPTQTSQSSQCPEGFYPFSKHETYIKEINKYAVLCDIKDQYLDDDYATVKDNLSTVLQKIPRPSRFDFEINLWLAREKESSTMTLHLVVTCGSEQEKATVAPYCVNHTAVNDFLTEHDATLVVIVRDAASKIEPASSSDLSVSADKTIIAHPWKCKLLLPRSQKSLYGAKIEIQSESGILICSCTLGGIVLVGSSLYGWTARHCLNSDSSRCRPKNSGSDAESSYQSGINSLEAFDVKLVYPATLNQTGRQTDGFDYDWLLLDISKLPPRLFINSVDWTDRHNRIPRSTLPERTEPEEPVTISVQGSNIFRGSLNRFPATITLGQNMHRVKIIELEQPLPRGSSGAWVLYNQQLCGFIIAVRKEPAWAYMIPIQEAFRDITNLTGDAVHVATTEDLEEIASTSRSNLNPPSNGPELGPSREEFDKPADSSSQSGILLQRAPSSPLSTSGTQNLPTRFTARFAQTSSSMGSGFARDQFRARIHERAKRLLTRVFSPKQGRRDTCAGRGVGDPAQKIHHPRKRLLLLDGADLHERATIDEHDSLLTLHHSSFASGSSGQHNLPEVAKHSINGTKIELRKHINHGPFKLPRKVPCRILIGLDGSRAEHVCEYMLTWLVHKDTFWELAGMVETCLRNTGYTAIAKGYIRSGTCSLFRGNIENTSDPCLSALPESGQITMPSGHLFDSATVENEVQWMKNVPPMILRFCALAQDTPFYLEISWDIIRLSPGSGPSTNLSDLLPSMLLNNRQWNWENHWYVPQKALRNIMSPPFISHLLQSHKGLRTIAGRHHELVYRLCRSSWRLMAVVISAGLQLDDLLLLIGENIDDSKLPLNSKMRPQVFPIDKYEKIISEQYAFMALSFGSASGTRPYRTIAKEMIVPLKFDVEKDRIGKGYTGEAFKVHLNPEHHNFDTRTPCFVIKRFMRQSGHFDEENGREQRILTNLSMVRHDHLLAPVTSWQQSNSLFMLFPYAGLNLESFLRHAPTPNLSRDVTLGFLNELKGIADAVRVIHNLGPAGLAPIEAPGLSRVMPTDIRGFHHDLQPANILIFSRPGQSVGTWMISDFGMARISQTFSGLKTAERKERLGYHDKTYGAPDQQLGFQPSRSYDIFSLGCFYLEFLIWMCGVRPDFDDFAAQRMDIDGSKRFWHNSQGVISLKPTVIDALRSLRKYAESRGVLEPLVQMVENMLAVEPSERPTAPEIVNAMDAILLQANVDLSDDEFYLTDRATTRKLAAPPPSGLSTHSQSIVDGVIPRRYDLEDDIDLDSDTIAHGPQVALAGNEVLFSSIAAWSVDMDMDIMREELVAPHESTAFWTPSENTVFESLADLNPNVDWEYPMNIGDLAEHQQEGDLTGLTLPQGTDIEDASTSSQYSGQGFGSSEGTSLTPLSSSCHVGRYDHRGAGHDR